MYVSDAMVKRLPAYYRHLKELERKASARSPPRNWANAWD